LSRQKCGSSMPAWPEVIDGVWSCPAFAEPGQSLPAAPWLP
jgi:hypothetical protein